jgi:hypothetical protein
MNDDSDGPAGPGRPPHSPGGVCPHLDRNDLRCATRLSLGRIEQAFSVCFGAYHGCPMFHRINGEQAPVMVTVSCRETPDVADMPLRPTGT